jgi:drug/metabolite transporter (DMT)-like permease
MMHIPAGVAVPGRFFIGLVTLTVMALINGQLDLGSLHLEKLALPEVYWNYIGLVTIAGTVPTFLYLKGLAHTSATVGGFCEMTQTVVAILVSWIGLGQPLLPLQIVFGLGLLFAVYKININYAKANKRS